jgi:tetratricopeptide (TPR) repeat protein
MRMGLCAFLCLVGVAPSAIAQTVDKAKLRQAIEMPTVSSFLGVRFNSSERDSRGALLDPVKKIADLQKKITGGPDDAQVYFDLRTAYLEHLRDEKKGKEMATKAEAMLRPYTNTKDPKLAHLVTIYGSTVEALTENPWKDCEGWARYAVSVGPQDWRTWTYLAHARHQQIPIILVGGDEKQLPKFGRTQEIIGALHLKRLSPENVDAAEKVLNEVLQYHDKAKELAPNDPLRQERRYGFRVTEVVLRNAIATFRGQKAPYPMVQVERILLDELQATARLQPEHLLWQSQLVHYMTIAGWRQVQDEKGKTAKKFSPARPEDAVAMREAMSRIDRLADDSTGEAAIFCHTMAATLCASYQDYVSVEKHARKVLQLDKKNQIAWEQLEHALYNQERYADMLKEVETLTKVLPTARNCYVLAKALAKNQQYDLAMRACLDGLKIDKTEPHCHLGIAALLMRNENDPDALKVARIRLDDARRECKPESGPTLFNEIEYLTAIYQALTGEPSFARLTLDRLRTDNPDPSRYDKALTAIGR